MRGRALELNCPGLPDTPVPDAEHSWYSEKVEIPRVRSGHGRLPAGGRRAGTAPPGNVCEGQGPLGKAAEGSAGTRVSQGADSGPLTQGAVTPRPGTDLVAAQALSQLPTWLSSSEKSSTLAPLVVRWPLVALSDTFTTQEAAPVREMRPWNLGPETHSGSSRGSTFQALPPAPGVSLLSPRVFLFSSAFLGKAPADHLRVQAC